MGMENKLIPDYAITASSQVCLTVMFLLSLNIQAICMLGKIDVLQLHLTFTCATNEDSTPTITKMWLSYQFCPGKTSKKVAVYSPPPTNYPIRSTFSVRNLQCSRDYARLPEKISILFLSGMETMDRPMQGYTIWQAAERRAPGLRGQMTNHSGFR